jgi:adenylosuccinate lyase
MAEERYCFPEIAEIWKESAKYKRWLKVETTIIAVQELFNLIPQGICKEITNANLQINETVISEIESSTEHDVVAFVKSIEKQLPKKARPYFHRNVTSYDIVDTSLSIAMCRSLDLIIFQLLSLLRILKSEMEKYKHVPQIGRTHGMHAEPITFGLKIANWHAELERHLERIKEAQKKISIGKISGSVGMYNLPPEVEKEVCKKLGLKPDKISTQIIARDRHVDYIYALTLLACSLEKFATEIRNLQRPEISEIQEGFKKSQKGSSIMPFKKNPVKSENICSLARVLRGFLQTAMENVTTWHERDLANSANERIILKDAAIYCYFMLRRFQEIILGWNVNEKRMLDNIYLSRGVIFSSKIVSKLTEKGMAYQKAYDLVQKIAFETLEESYPEIVRKHLFENKLLYSAEITDYLTVEEIDECFDLKKQFLSHVDEIFGRFKTKEE